MRIFTGDQVRQGMLRREKWGDIDVAERVRHLNHWTLWQARKLYLTNARKAGLGWSSISEMV